VSSGCIRPHDKLVQLIEIALRQIAGPLRICVLHLDGDNATFLVFSDLRNLGEMFGGIDSITLVINVLQVEPVNEMAGHRSAAKEVDEKIGRRAPTRKGAGETAYGTEASGVGSQRSEHHSGGALLVWGHNAGDGLVLFWYCERDGETDKQGNRGDTSK
jgi:hypothetical protein